MTEGSGRYSPTLSPSELELLNPRELEKLDIEYEKLMATRFHVTVSSRTRSLPIRALLLKLCLFFQFHFSSSRYSSPELLSFHVWAIGLRPTLCLKGVHTYRRVTE